jgi:hypothetical protein
VIPHSTHFCSQCLAHQITSEGVDDDALAKSPATARVQLNPHQVDAALSALATPIARGAVLADEVGLGNTIETGLIIAQRRAERRRRIFLILTASLRKQATQDLSEKLGIDALMAGLAAKFPLPEVIEDHSRGWNDVVESVAAEAPTGL